MLGNSSRSINLSRRLVLLATALVASLALAGVAAGNASALSFETTSGGTKSFFTFTGFGFEDHSTNEYANTWKCTGSEGYGTFSGSAGEIKLWLTGCKSHFDFGGTYFETAESSNPETPGKIVTNWLPFKLVYLDAAKTRYGILIEESPYSHQWSTFSAPGLMETTWHGDLIAEIAGLALNQPGTFIKLNFRAENNQVEGSGNYRLTENLTWLYGSETGKEAGAPGEAYWVHTFRTNLEQEGKFVP